MILSPPPFYLNKFYIETNKKLFRNERIKEKIESGSVRQNGKITMNM